MTAGTASKVISSNTELTTDPYNHEIPFWLWICLILGLFYSFLHVWSWFQTKKRRDTPVVNTWDARYVQEKEAQQKLWESKKWQVDGSHIEIY